MVPFQRDSVAPIDGQSARHRIQDYTPEDGIFAAPGGTGAVYRKSVGIPRSIMHSIRSTLVVLSGCAALAGSGCDSRVQLGALTGVVSSLQWWATFETRDLSEWQRDGDGGIFYEDAA